MVSWTGEVPPLLVTTLICGTLGELTYAESGTLMGSPDWVMWGVLNDGAGV